MAVQINDGETFGVHRGKLNNNFSELETKKADKTNVLEKDNTITFTPTGNYHPATKIYVDNSKASLIGIYDPQEINADAFNRGNHTGVMDAQYVTQTSNYRFVSDAEKTSWNAKENGFTKNTAFNKNFGTIAGSVAEGNHSHVGVYEPANVNIQTHIASTSNPHNVTKTQIGLGNVPNVDCSNASNISSGTLNEARLPSNVTLDTEVNSATTTLLTNSYYTQAAINTALATKKDKTDYVSEQISIGDVVGGNFFAVDTNGIFTAHGNARFKKSIEISINGAELHPTLSPTYVNYKGSRVLSFSASADQTIYFQAKLPHDYEPGTDIEFHVHGLFQSATTGVRRYTLTHSWANTGEAFPTESSVVTDFSVVRAADENVEGSFGIIDGTGKEESSILLCSLTRNGSDVIDTEPGATLIVFMDFHYIANSLGTQTGSLT